MLHEKCYIFKLCQAVSQPETSVPVRLGQQSLVGIYCAVIQPKKSQLLDQLDAMLPFGTLGPVGLIRCTSKHVLLHTSDLVGCLVSLLVRFFVDYLVGWFVGWSVGWLVC